jgi:hypothetical protein
VRAIDTEAVTANIVDGVIALTRSLEPRARGGRRGDRTPGRVAARERASVWRRVSCTHRRCPGEFCAAQEQLPGRCRAEVGVRRE